MPHTQACIGRHTSIAHTQSHKEDALGPWLLLKFKSTLNPRLGSPKAGTPAPHCWLEELITATYLPLNRN